MKIAIGQINAVVGNIEYNKNKIIHNIREAVSENADLIIFPELALTGYPLHDLSHELSFLKGQDAAIEEIRLSSKNIAIAFGFVDYIQGKSFLDRSFYKHNALMVIQNQKKIAVRHKTLLPNYDVFNERRYFAEAEKQEPVSLKIDEKEYRFGFHICEDLWDEHYKKKVCEELAHQNSDILINLSASPFELDKFSERSDLVQKYTDKFKLPYIYCNLVGNQDELIFDGHSFVYNQDSELCLQMGGFKEDLEYFEFSDKRKKVDQKCINEDELVYDALVFAIRDYFNKNNFKKAVIGLSGGIDSALVAVLAVDALGSENVLTVSMPSKYSSNHSIEDAEKLAKNLNCRYKTVPISGIHSTYEREFEEIFSTKELGLTDENIQARIRGNILMAYANHDNYIVLSTGNKTEFAMGYCTLYGDMCGAVSVIGDLSKERVYSVANYINIKESKERIPKRIITKKPSAELRPDQYDPFDYEKLSPLIDLIIEKRKSFEELIQMGYDKTTIKETVNKIYSSEYKRFQAAIIFKISSKSFGSGRIYPIVNQYRV